MQRQQAGCSLGFLRTFYVWSKTDCVYLLFGGAQRCCGGAQRRYVGAQRCHAPKIISYRRGDAARRPPPAARRPRGASPPKKPPNHISWGRSDAAPLRDAPANTQQLMMAGPSFGLGQTAAPRKRGDSLPVYLSITYKCLKDWRACYASIARLPQRSRGGSRTAPARRTEALRGRRHPASPCHSERSEESKRAPD